MSRVRGQQDVGGLGMGVRTERKQRVFLHIRSSRGEAVLLVLGALGPAHPSHRVLRGVSVAVQPGPRAVPWVP